MGELLLARAVWGCVVVVVVMVVGKKQRRRLTTTRAALQVAAWESVAVFVVVVVVFVGCGWLDGDHHHHHALTVQGGLGLKHSHWVCLEKLRSCVKVEVDILGSPSLIVPMVSVDVKQY